MSTGGRWLFRRWDRHEPIKLPPITHLTDDNNNVLCRAAPAADEHTFPRANLATARFLPERMCPVCANIVYGRR